MKSGGLILLDLSLNLVIYGNFLAVYNFFYSLAVFVFTSNFALNLYEFIVVFFFYT